MTQPGGTTFANIFLVNPGWNAGIRREASMGLSSNQIRIVRQMKGGYRLRIIRSPITHMESYAELYKPGEPMDAEVIGWWRIMKLIEAGQICPDPSPMEVATELILC
ncbi:hypothetical protein [Cupriavidus plantarum]|uniref:hypothetical protein n=1 Tax=Cupriavidus plantarum TaxID=942865 RepID=UPI0011C07DE3|nr:hypothetical protein [Cupriavidus plantarum]